LVTRDSMIGVTKVSTAKLADRQKEEDEEEKQ
jgi:hypothetical protein